MASSLVNFSDARAAPYKERESSTLARILRFICFGHCTPVERVQKSLVLSPIRPRFHVQLEEYLPAEKLLHFLTRLDADPFEHRALGADHDPFLALLLDIYGRENARDFGF